MQILDTVLKRLRHWCAERAAFDQTAGLDERTLAAIQASGGGPEGGRTA